MGLDSFSDYLKEDSELKSKWGNVFRQEFAKLEGDIPEKAEQIFSLVHELHLLTGSVWRPNVRSKKEVDRKIERIKEIRKEVEELVNG